MDTTASRALRAFVLVAMPAVLSAVPGSERPQNPPTFQGGVDVTQFDVTVLDRNRRVVRGLTAEDFTATVDGQPARIVAVTPVDIPPAPPPPETAWLRDVAPDVVTNSSDTRRIVVIVIDDALTGASSTAAVRLPGRVGQDRGLPSGDGRFRDPWILQAGKQIARDVVNGLGPNDLAAVAFTYVGRDQNFTSDRVRLLRAIETYVPQDGSPGGPLLGCAFRGRRGCTFDTLEHVIEALPTNPPLRKIIVLISQGSNIPGFGGFGLSADEARQALGDVPSATLEDIRLLFQRLQRANATLYAYSPGGLQVSNDRVKDDTLRAFAEVTGGRAVLNTNAPWEGVPAMFEETSSYYMVGVETPVFDGKFHRVKIQVDRPNAEVRTRTGFIAPRADGSYGPKPRKGASPPAPLDLAMMQGFPKGDLPLTAHVTTHRVRGRNEADVRVVVGIPSSSSSERAWPVALRVSAFEMPLYKEKRTFEQRVEVDPERGRIAEARANLRLGPGRYEVRVAGEGDERTGSVFLEVELPKFGKDPLWMSALGLTTSDAMPEQAPLTVRRSFAASDRVRLITQLVRGGNARNSNVRAELVVVDSGDKTVATQTLAIESSAFGADGTADLAIDLPLVALARGEHLATLKASAGEHRVLSHLRFVRE